ncbi:MAG: DEAD/DEAH box helicase [Methanobacteriaceae archaeon]|nr:DEAD/DEAH box helicase [Methanobacteriaceae archaeon]
MDFDSNILGGARTAFIDSDYKSSGEFKPQLLVNNNSGKVLNSIKEELHNCDEFCISVAFITMGGLTPLLQDLLELESKGVKGKILTTDYLNFTEPKALRKLEEFSNIEVKIYPQDIEGFHTKGYIFRKNNVYKAIVGSSNLTMNALTINKEWNIGFSSLTDGEILKKLLDEFNSLWNESSCLSEVLAPYESLYNSAHQFVDVKTISEEIKEESNEELVPNSMQVEFLENIRELIQKGENRALLVSATGTGKTYASAFAVRDFNPKKFLFLVHREQIAKQSIKAYKKVFGEGNFGLLSGSHKDVDADFLFSTVQSMSNDFGEINYLSFDPEEFDYIVIDEVHKAGAPSYQKLMNYFKPKFWLGMSASPDRTDGFNIYELFDYNIPLDIRLQDALEQDLLCPFHYFGITDLEVNGEILDDESDFINLVSNDRVNYLLEKSEYYSFSGDRIKALVFVSTTDEAHALSDEFNRRGHPSCVLTSEDSQYAREEAIDRLTNDNRNDNLEYIFTVNIFNEGVDIPEINQVLLVRPTESSIIFIQQLGRGLRKFKNKEYVVVLDFIGNYKNNFMIPIALSGDRTYDKDIIRKYVMEGNRIIPGASSISFDEVSKKRIYEAIDNAKFSKISLFKEKYQNLKFRLGRIPYLVDFYKNGELDPSLILNHNQFDCYHNFLKKVDKDYDCELSDEEIKSLKFISDVLSNGKRPHELLILKLLVYNKYFNVELLEKCLSEYKINNFKSIRNAFRVFNLDFFIDKDKNKYSGFKFFEFNSGDFFDLRVKDYPISNQFKQFLANPVYYKHLMDVLDYSLAKYEDKYANDKGNALNLYEKYSRKDVCRLLNWDSDESSVMYGYKIKYGTCPIFVTYNKDTESISSTTNYADEFVSREVFSWMSKSKRTLDSKDVKSIIKDNLDIHLFIKKSDDEGKEFYYLGEVNPFEWNETTIYNDKKDTEEPIVNFKLKMGDSVPEDIYNYFKDSL